MKIANSDGRFLDAEIMTETRSDGIHFFVESRGGTVTGEISARNPDYEQSFGLLLQRLASLSVSICKILLASRKVEALEESQRSLDVAGYSFPLRLSPEKAEDFRKAVGRSVALAHRNPDSKSRGNPTKRIELVVSNYGSEDDFLSIIQFGTSGRKSSQTWIFQANPDHFGIDKYLSERFVTGLPIRWVARQHRADIRIGDKVYLWRAGGRRRKASGIVAKATILTHPMTLADDSEGLWSEPQMSDELRVLLQIEEVRLKPEDQMLLREDIRKDSLLMSMRILRVATGTNYRLTEEQAVRLEDLWVGTTGNQVIVGDFVGQEASFPEGRLVERTHVMRERNQKLVQYAKIAFVRKHGKLFCEVCGFDAKTAYGMPDDALIEAHHNRAVSELSPEESTRIEDLSMLCPNCHRAIHRQRPWLTVDELKMRLNRDADS